MRHQLLVMTFLSASLATSAANAECDYLQSAQGPCGWKEYPQPQEYGTRTDIYLTDDGRIERAYQHLSNDEDDEVRVYGGGGYDYEADEFGEGE